MYHVIVSQTSRFVQLPDEGSAELAGGKKKASSCTFGARTEVAIRGPSAISTKKQLGILCGWQVFVHKTTRFVHLLTEQSMRLASGKRRGGKQLIFLMMEVMSLFAVWYLLFKVEDLMFNS